MKSPNKKATPIPKTTVNTESAPVNKNDAVETTVNAEPAPVNKNDAVETTVNAEPAPVTKIDAVETTVNAEPAPVKENDFKVYSCKLSIEEHLHVSQTVNKGIEVGVFENNNDYLRKCIDFYLNHNPICVAMGLKPHLEVPLLDGRNGSEYVAPKLLKNSLLKGLTNLPQF